MSEMEQLQAHNEELIEFIGWLSWQHQCVLTIAKEAADQLPINNSFQKRVEIMWDEWAKCRIPWEHTADADGSGEGEVSGE